MAKEEDIKMTGETYQLHVMGDGIEDDRVDAMERSRMDMLQDLGGFTVDATPAVQTPAVRATAVELAELHTRMGTPYADFDYRGFRH